MNLFNKPEKNKMDEFLNLGEETGDEFKIGNTLLAGGNKTNSNIINNNGNALNIMDTPLFKASSDEAVKMTKGETPMFNAQANEAREAQKSQQALRDRNIRQGLFGAGLGDTGRFVEEGILQPEQQKYRERQELERGLASDRQNLSLETQKAGQQAGTNLLGTLGGIQQTGMQAGSSEKIATMNIANDQWKTSRAEELTRAGWTQEEAMQKSEQEFKENQNRLDRILTLDVEGQKLTLEEKKLAQNAMQFDNQIDFERWAVQKGISADEAKRAWQAGENAIDRAMQIEEAGLNRLLTREIESGKLTIEQAKLSQQASQFKSDQKFQEWALSQGWEQEDIARAWQTSENNKERSMQVTQAGFDRDLTREVEAGRLTLQEAELAQKAYQFDTQLEFEERMTQEGWGNEAIARAWQESENAKNRISQEKMAEFDRELTRELESGRISIQEKELIQQAAQFKSEDEYKRWSTIMGIDDNIAYRIWETSENMRDRQYNYATLDWQRQMDRANLSLNEREYLESIRKFDDKLEFDKWAVNKGIESEEAERLWQTKENFEDRQHESHMQLIDNELREKLANYESLMTYADTLPAESRAAIIEQAAKNAGVDIRFEYIGSDTSDDERMAIDSFFGEVDPSQSLIDAITAEGNKFTNRGDEFEIYSNGKWYTFDAEQLQAIYNKKVQVAESIAKVEKEAEKDKEEDTENGISDSMVGTIEKPRRDARSI